MQPVRLRRAPRTILVLAQPGFGDVLLATPLIRSLKTAWPEAAIDVMVHSGREAMLAGNPDVRHAVPIPKRPNPLQFLGILARTSCRYDLALAIALNDRGVFVLRCTARRFVAVFRGHKRKDWWKHRVMTASVDADRMEHEMLRYLMLADLLGIERSYAVVAPHDAGAPALLDERLDFAWREEPYAVIHPTTHATRKRWRIEAWKAVGRRLEERGLRCVITGALNKQIAAHLGIAEKTVKIHRARVMEKIGVASVAELVQSCQRAGIELPRQTTVGLLSVGL